MNTFFGLKVDGLVDSPKQLTFADLSQITSTSQITDVSQLAGGRPGAAITLKGLLDLVGAQSNAKYLGLHSSHDDFHASIPLAPVLQSGLLIYCLNGAPLAQTAGGPVRFFIPNHAACHTEEIDECANVKFVDHIELTADKGFDNRPEDDQQHEALHQNE